MMCILLMRNSSSLHIDLQEHAGHQSSGKHSRGQARWKGKASSRKSRASYMNMSSEALWSDIQEFAMVKYKVSVLT